MRGRRSYEPAGPLERGVRPQIHRSSRQHSDELDSSAMPLKHVIDKIADYQVRLSGAFVYNAARQDFRCRIPLDVDRSATTLCSAPQFGPPWRATGLSLEHDLKIVRLELRVISNCIAHA
jgi:hypothetical protein